MFDCLDLVPESTEEEIRNVLILTNWDLATAVQKLKIGQLMKCPDKEWKFACKKDESICRMVLNSVLGDLGLANSRVRNGKRSRHYDAQLAGKPVLRPTVPHEA